VGHISSHPRYSSIRKFLIGEWKYFTDDNLIKETHHLIIKKVHFANALRSDWHGTHMAIIPIVMSRTCIPHTLEWETLTHTGVTTLINSRTFHANKPSRTPTRDIVRIIAHLYIHYV
jgi:hypothetical protein